MIISVNWLKKFTAIDIPIDDLVELIGTRLVEVEHVVDLGTKYKNILVARVVSAEKMEDSDHLSLTRLDDGGVTGGIERDENGLVQVVCGAPNVAAGQMVAWLPPGAIIPETFGTTEPVILDSRQLRGVVSNGMIASSKELDLFDENSGILVLDNDLKPGMTLADAYELNDYLLDIENKSLTHRPDVFGIIGFAREIAAIQGKKFVLPDLLSTAVNEFTLADEPRDLTVTIDRPELCDRYQAIVVSGAQNKKSPLLIQTYLARVGVRPINAVVDVTNYLMILTGQPLHAFDFDKLVKVGGGKADIHVRNAREGEELGLLDGKTTKLSPDDIVIAAGQTAIGLAGAMGGANTEIDGDTRDIIIESATFNLYNLRGTQMRHGIFSEAITRFTKGQPAELTSPVIHQAIKLMGEWAGAKPVSQIVEAYPVKQPEITINLEIKSVNDVLGTKYDAEKVSTVLRNAEFRVEEAGEGKLKVAVPWWRADIHFVEDLAEEVGRLYGFDNIAPTLPLRNFVAVKPSQYDEFKSKVRKILVRAGANEVLTYSFVHGDVIRKSGQDPDNSYRIVNSLSPDLQYYRQTLTPSLLGLVHPNIKQGFEEFAIFELNKIHQKSDGMTNENVPVENDSTALTVSSKNGHPGSPYYQAKAIFEFLAENFGVSVRFEEVSSSLDTVARPFEPKRCAIIIAENDSKIGYIGEYKQSVSKNFKLPTWCAGFEVDSRALFLVAETGKVKYQPISRYPSTERDICFKTDEKVSYRQIIDAAASLLESISESYELSPVDIYQLAGSATKNTTIRVKLNAGDRTLNNEEVGVIINHLIDSVVSATGASVI